MVDLIITQKNLKFKEFYYSSMRDVFPFLMTKLSNTLNKLNIRRYNSIPLSSIIKFSNLQELELSLYYKNKFIKFFNITNFKS